MQIHYKEKALLANEYKLEKAERTKNWVGRNWINVALFGIFMSIVGPVYTHAPDGIHRTKAVAAVNVSDFGHLGTGVVFAIFYTFCMLIAYWTGKYQDKKKIAQLKEDRAKIEAELQALRDQL